MAEVFRLAINSISQDFDWSALRNASDYRGFLRSYLKIRGLNFSDFARVAGFARSYPADVVSGKRRLTTKSFYAFEKALRIPQPGKKLFRLLVAEKESDLFPEINRQQIQSLIESLRKKSWTRGRKDWTTDDLSSANDLLENPDMAVVFAATGEPGVGATLEEIHARTQLPLSHLNALLLQWRGHGFIDFNEGRYSSKDLHIFLEGVDKKKIFSKNFKRNAIEAGERAENSWNSESEFFFSSAFCIEESRLPALKNALKETILSFVDDAIQADGNKVVRLVTALHK